jgi:hypothetical protein
VFVDDVVDRNGRIYFRCHVEETLQQMALEIPDWMFAETCCAIGTVDTPVVSCTALRDLKELLEGASSHDPDLTEAQCFGGSADATDTGSKALSTRTVSANHTDTDVCNDVAGSEAEDNRTHLAFAPPTLGTPMRKPGQGGRS